MHLHSASCSSRSTLLTRTPPTSPLFPSTTLFRSALRTPDFLPRALFERFNISVLATTDDPLDDLAPHATLAGDRKSTRLNSSHVATSYAVFCLKNKTTYQLVAAI